MFHKTLPGRNTVIPAAFLLVLAILGAIALLALRNMETMARIDEWEKHTELVRDLDGLLSALKDVETGERGYIITGEERYLEPYRSGLAEVERKLASVQKLTSDNPSQQRRLEALAPLIREKISLSAMAINARTEGGFEAGYRIVASGKGKKAMDEIRVRIAEALDEETRLLQKRTARKENHVRTVLAATLWGAGLSLVLIVVMFLLLRKENEARAQVEQDLRSYRDRLEELVRERTAELEQAKNKAESAEVAKSQFLANMSHEMRTPLSAVIGYAELLLAEPRSDEERSYLEKIVTSARSLVELLQDIIDMSVSESGVLGFTEAPMNVGACVGTVVAMFQAKASLKGLQMTARVDEAIPASCLGDERRLRQVLVKLVGNAVKFTAGGEVVIDVHRLHEGETDFALFTVRDTGIGIPQEKVTTLFRKFTQVDSSTTRRYGGLGLGLALAKEIVEKMGGRIWVETTEGKGTMFSFTIPLKECGREATGRSESGTLGGNPTG